MQPGQYWTASASTTTSTDAAGPASMLIALAFGSAIADAAPTATSWQTDLSGDQLTFQVRYTDDISISASTFDSNDAYVVTPEGFHLQAEFLSADTTLLPGTVIITGTPHGVGMGMIPQIWLKAGDTVTIEIEKIGKLTNHVE